MAESIPSHIAAQFEAATIQSEQHKATTAATQGRMRGMLDGLSSEDLATLTYMFAAMEDKDSRQATYWRGHVEALLHNRSVCIDCGLEHLEANDFCFGDTGKDFIVGYGDHVYRYSDWKRGKYTTADE